MMQAAANLLYLDTGHTGGHSVPSDIVMPDEIMMRLYPPANDDVRDFEVLDEGEEEDGFMEIDDVLGPLLVWRGPKRNR